MHPSSRHHNLTNQNPNLRGFPVGKYHTITPPHPLSYNPIRYNFLIPVKKLERRQLTFLDRHKVPFSHFPRRRHAPALIRPANNQLPGTPTTHPLTGSFKASTRRRSKLGVGPHKVTLSNQIEGCNLGIHSATCKRRISAPPITHHSATTLLPVLNNRIHR